MYSDNQDGKISRITFPFEVKWKRIGFLVPTVQGGTTIHFTLAKSKKLTYASKLVWFRTLGKALSRQKYSCAQLFFGNRF